MGTKLIIFTLVRFFILGSLFILLLHYFLIKNNQKKKKMAENLTKISQNRWSPDQQALIKLFHEEKSIKSWKIISQAVNSHLKECQIGIRRNSKQCRDRYVNYIKYDSSTSEKVAWTSFQINTMFQKYIEFGPRWTIIAKQISNRFQFSYDRSENSIKNKFYNCLRKFSRKLNLIIRQNKNIKTKPLKYELLMKALEFNKVYSCQHLSQHVTQKENFDDYLGLRLKIIQNLQSFEQECYKVEQFAQLLERIIEFRKATKFITLPKVLGARTESRFKNLGQIKQDDLISSTDKSKSQIQLNEIQLDIDAQKKKIEPKKIFEDSLPEEVKKLQLQMIDEDNFEKFRSSLQNWKFSNEMAMNELFGEHCVSAFF